MSDRIPYSQGEQTGKMLAQAVNKQLDALADMRRIKALLDKAQAGIPADWPAVAVELGLPNSVDGHADAQDAWTIVSTALAAVDVGAVAELSRLDQG